MVKGSDNPPPARRDIGSPLPLALNPTKVCNISMHKPDKIALIMFMHWTHIKMKEFDWLKTLSGLCIGKTWLVSDLSCTCSGNSQKIENLG